MKIPFNQIIEKKRSKITGRYIQAERAVTGVYALRNTANDKVYVGAAKNVLIRRRVHLRKLKKRQHSNSRLQNDFNKYGVASFIFEVLELTQNLLVREQFWMDKLQSCLKGYNYGTARSSQLGSVWTEQQCEQSRIRARRLWKQGIFHRPSKVVRRKMSQSHLGKKRSLASRQKQSQTLKELHRGN